MEATLAETPARPADCSETKPKKRRKSISNERLPRKSLRNTDKLILPAKGTLAHRKLDDLFFRKHSTLGPHHSIGSKLKFVRVHCEPNIYVVDDFLTATEMDHFRRKIEAGKFQRSFVDQVSSTSAEKDEKVCFDGSHRTSTFLSFTKQHDSVIARIERRVADECLSLPISSVEALQLVRYKPKQFFGVHHDLGDFDEARGTVELPRKSCWSRRRLVTFFCYLNESDGATHFPEAGNLRVQPRPGRAVVFANMLENGDPDCRTIHAGEPPTKLKYGVNIWVCEDYH